MLRLTLSTEEYLMIGDNIKIAFLGGSKSHLRILIDAPKEVGVVRSKVMEQNVPEEERGSLPQYYAEPELAERFRKKKSSSKAGS
ncbi:MAG: carbon storage regulator [Lachnospiraceae bacterium]|nr:carbon storage regulator [Lachnospiraceae bacterium]